VFVTKTFEDAKLAARTVVRGCPSVVTANGERIWNTNDDEIKSLQNYSLVIPVGGDGTLSGWINTMVDEILLFHKLEHDAEEDTSSKNNETTTSNETSNMSVEEAMQQLPVLAYIPMGTGNGLGYVIGCKAGKESSNTGGEVSTKSILSKINVFTYMKRQKLERARQVMARLKEVGDAIQDAEQFDITNAISSKCSIVEMPVMQVTHPSSDSTSSNGNSDENGKGDLCFFAGAGFDSLMLHDFQQIKAWSKNKSSSSTAVLLPSFVKDALSSVAGYCVALVTKTLPQTLRYGSHKIHVEVTTMDEDTLWVDHRRGDFSELAVQGGRKKGQEEVNDGSSSRRKKHLIYKGTTGIIAASTTPYYGGGMRLFPYARLIPDKLQLRLGRISPLTGVVNILGIFAGSYRETSDREFGCMDFIGTEFEVEVRGSGGYKEYVRKESEKKKGRRRKRSLFLRWMSRRGKHEQSRDDDDQDDGNSSSEKQQPISTKGFPFQHSGESMGIKERFRLRVVQEPVKFVSFLEPRVVRDD